MRNNLLVICFCTALVFTTAEHVHAQSYTITQLEPQTTSAGNFSRALGINNKGVVIGDGSATFTPGIIHIWAPGQFPEVRYLYGYNRSTAAGINDLGQYVGNGYEPDGFHGFLGSTDLGLGSTNDINNRGQVVGWTWDSSYIYENGVFDYLPTSYWGSEAVAINDSGIAVGYWLTNCDTKCYSDVCMFRNDSLIFLGREGEATDINFRGQVVGWGCTNSDCSQYRGFIWNNGDWTTLSTLGGTGSEANAINDYGIVVGEARTSYDTYIPPHAFIYDTLHGLRDLNTLIPQGSGWELLSAYDINNAGQIVGIGYINGLTRGFLLTPTDSGQISITNPTAGELLIAGEKDTIRWTDQKVGSIAISVILHDDQPDETVVPIVDAYPVNTGSYEWDIPDSLLSRKCRIVIRDATHPGVVDTSDIFKIKGYVLTNNTPDGDYFAYDPAWDRWGFKNTSADVWPASWFARFNYSGTDPFTGYQYSQWQGGGLGSGTFSSASSSDHPDWPSFVNTFSVSACYVSTTLGIYSPTALARWASSKSAWNGSCFGIAIANAIVFRNSGAFWGRYPQYPFFAFPIQVTSDTNTIPVINELFTHQLGNPHLLIRRTVGLLKTPNQTLNDLKAMCLSETASVRTLSILNNGPGGGGHAILAYKVKRDTTQVGLYNVYVYDNSWSDSTNAYLIIDTTLNGGQGGWSYSLWPGWGGSQWIYLRDPAINYLTNPTLPKIDPRDRFSPFILPDEVLEINTVNGATVRIQDANGNTSGYIDSLVLSDIPGSVPLVIENGSKMPPAGYSLPMGSYSVELSDFKTPQSGVFFFTGNSSIIVGRADAQETQTDLLYFDGSVALANHDGQSKIVHLTDIINESFQEKLFDLSSISMATGDSLAMTPLGSDGLKLTSFGSQKTYELEIVYSTDTGIARYKHGSVPLSSNTSYVYTPDWSGLGNGDGLSVFVDEGNDGSVDDTLLLENQVTDARDRGELNLPDRFELFQNYPNPFNPTTTIRYEMPKASHVKLSIFNVLGKEVAVPVEGMQNAGYKSVKWDASSFSSGVYFYRIQTDGFVQTKKMVLIR